VAFGAGASDYLVKPFPVEDLLAKVRDLLED
jgi:DNA-binding response OmpR family regulator